MKICKKQWPTGAISFASFLLVMCIGLGQILQLPALALPIDEPAAVVDRYAAPTFRDVPPSDKFYTEITWAVSNGITQGVSEGVFAPNTTCNHGQIITYLWRAFGQPIPTVSNPFSNVTANNYYYQPVLWAYEKGLLSGGTFNAEAACTRLSAVTYLWRAANSPSPSASATFSDVSSNTTAVSWAVEQGITNGYATGEFKPNATCTRAQIIVFLYRDLVTAGNKPVSAVPAINPEDLPENGKYQITVAEGVYEYTVKDGKIDPSSWVTFKHNNGTIYTGQMSGNKFSGQCSISYNTGDSYIGNLSQNLKSGDGKYVWANGDSYSGKWANDLMNGQGTYSYASGGSISGTFLNNSPNGSCVYIDTIGSAYTAVWENGVCASMTKR